MHTDHRIDKYIQALPSWQQDICERVRELIHQAEPDIIETIKRTDKPYFTLQGNVCALLAAKDHVNVFIYDPTVADPHKLINQGLENKTAKSIQIYEGNEIDETAFQNLIKNIVKNNQAGGWRKLQKKHL